MISIQNGLWKLQGYDTFAHEYYLLDGEFDTEAGAITGVFAQHIRMLSGVLRGKSPAVDAHPALSTSDSIWLD